MFNSELFISLTNDYFVIDDFFFMTSYVSTYTSFTRFMMLKMNIDAERILLKKTTSLIEKNANCKRKKSSHVADIFVNNSTFESEHR